MSDDWSDSSSGWSSGRPSPLQSSPLAPLEEGLAGPEEGGGTSLAIEAAQQGADQLQAVCGPTTAEVPAAGQRPQLPPVAAEPEIQALEQQPAEQSVAIPEVEEAATAQDADASDPDTPHAVALEAPVPPLAPMPEGTMAAAIPAPQDADEVAAPAAVAKPAQVEQPEPQETVEQRAAAKAPQPAAADIAVPGSQGATAATGPLQAAVGQLGSEQQDLQQGQAPAEAANEAGDGETAAGVYGHAAIVPAEPSRLVPDTQCDQPPAPLRDVSTEQPQPCDTAAAAAVQSGASLAVNSEAAPSLQHDATYAASVDATVLVAARSNAKEGALQGPQPQPKEWQLAALPPPPLATYPVQQLQAVLGSGLVSMRHRLTAAADRESALR